MSESSISSLFYWSEQSCANHPAPSLTPQPSWWLGFQFRGWFHRSSIYTWIEPSLWSRSWLGASEVGNSEQDSVPSAFPAFMASRYCVTPNMKSSTSLADPEALNFIWGCNDQIQVSSVCRPQGLCHSPKLRRPVLSPLSSSYWLNDKPIFGNGRSTKTENWADTIWPLGLYTHW